jgi:hypothetical protein
MTTSRELLAWALSIGGQKLLLRLLGGGEL